MDAFTRLSFIVLSDLEQLETALKNGDTSQEPVARHLLKRLIDLSDGPKLHFWVRAIGMVASKAVELEVNDG